MEIIENTSKLSRKDDSSIKIQDILSICIARWRWFVLSLVITLGAAAFYLLRTPSVYTRSASILIKEDTKGQSVSSEMDFANLGLFQSSTNVNNEILTLRSPATMYEVARRLSLHKSYMAEGRFHRTVAYGTSLPLTVDIAGFPESEGAGMTVTVSGEGSVTLSDFSRNGEDIDAEPVTATLGEPTPTPIGEVTVSPTPFFTGSSRVIYFTQSSIQAAASAYASSITIARAEEGASVINLTMKDVSIQRADDILNTLISVYNENWVKDKNQIAVSTSVFINERLAIIENELGNVDESISSYKSEHMIPDLSTASNMYINQSVEANAQILQLNNQLYMIRYIRDHLTNDVNRYDLLPATGTESAGIESQISEYNTLLLQRNNLVTASSASNPVVIDLDRNLDAMRSAIVTSLDNHRVMLETQLRTLESTEQQATDRIAATPDQAKYLLSVERQQKVKEALYLFLLQKREENELSQAFTAYNTRIINPPSGSAAPTAPAKTRIVIIALVIGLVVPTGIIFLMELTNTKVRGRKDVEGLTMPFLGEIPQVSDGTRHGTIQRLTEAVHRFKNKGKNKPNEGKELIAVKEGSRDVINEAFRVLRTNLEFMTRKDGHTDVIIVTSFNPGSGKTFITMNLGMTLAIKNQRVLVIDGDLRHGSASRFVGSPKKGLSDWLGGQSASYLDLIIPHPGHKGLDVLPIGTIPPNPTELISDQRMSTMLEDLRSRYDYILIDCPPVDIVADTQIFERLTDRTVFIVRAGLLERSMLTDLESLYQQGQYRNMALVLNGTEGGGRYGYRHGYRYGYKYGYHYGYYGHNYYNDK